MGFFLWDYKNGICRILWHRALVQSFSSPTVCREVCKGSIQKTTNFITFLYSSKRIDKLWWAQLGSVVWFSLRKTDKPRNNFHTFPVTNYTKNIYLNFSHLYKNYFVRGHVQTTWTEFWAILTPFSPSPLSNDHRTKLLKKYL